MATLYWTGNAVDRKQVTTVTVADVWAAGDTATLTINGNSVTITVGASVSTSDIAANLAAAVNATSRLDGTGAALLDSSSNVGGQEIGEFQEISATSSSAVLTLTAKTAGKPFTVTVAEVTAGSGTLGAPADSQTATGRNFWNNVANWSTGAVPVDDDIVVFQNNTHSVKYGLPNASLEVTIQQFQNYTGTIGLPENNTDNTKSYREYRQRYVRLDDAGTGTDIQHIFGMGDGTGSTMINVRHATVKCSVLVYNTGSPQIAGTKALNIVCGAATSVLNIIKGSVSAGTQDSLAASWATIRMGYLTSQASDVDLLIDGGTAVTVIQGGGVFSLRGTIGGNFVNTMISGTCRVEDATFSAALYPVFDITNATLVWNTDDDLYNFAINNGGHLDCSKDLRPFVVATDSAIYRGGKFSDPSSRITWTGDLLVSSCGIPDVTIDLGQNPNLAIT